MFNNPYFKRAIKITGSGIDEWLNQPHKHYIEKNELLLNIVEVIEKSTYLGFLLIKGGLRISLKPVYVEKRLGLW